MITSSVHAGVLVGLILCMQSHCYGFICISALSYSVNTTLLQTSPTSGFYSFSTPFMLWPLGFGVVPMV